MAVNDPLYINEGGLPLNAIDWLETHHRSKSPEREQMIRDIYFKHGSYVVDAGCGPGLWTPLLARAIGYKGRILGVDVSPEALVTAYKRMHGKWFERMVRYKRGLMEQLPVPYGSIDLIFSANVSQYLPEPVSTFSAIGPLPWPRWTPGNEGYRLWHDAFSFYRPRATGACLPGA